MKKRIIAWILLAGFVLLLLNLIIFRFYWQLSMIVYIVIVIAFVMTNGKLIDIQDDNGNESPHYRGSNDVDGDNASGSDTKGEN
ncbi:MAG: hypothetical protein ACM3XR_11900 [Bacillota bacterium]